MKNALIGYTGFVGQNIDHTGFYSLINSKNIKDFNGQRFELLIIAAGDARKWYANQNPSADMLHMLRLFNDVKNIMARNVILFSTVDVYDEERIAEGIDETSIEFSNKPYGMHRLMFEELIKGNYENVSIVRLPGLFGKGLKKNVIFDLCHDRRDQLCNYNVNSAFQYFDLSKINEVIEYVLKENIQLMNLISEQVTIKDIVKVIGYNEDIFNEDAKIINYDIKSNLRADGYFYSKDEILNSIKEFYNHEKGRI